MQRLGMAPLGFCNIYINELFSERDMDKNLIEYGLRDFVNFGSVESFFYLRSTPVKTN